MLSGNVISFDTETTGLSPWHGDMPFAFAFCNEDEDIWYVEFDVDPKTRKPIIQHDLLEEMQEVLENPRIEKVMHNAKFDVRMMEQAYGVSVRGEIHDTYIMAHACNSQLMDYGLKPLSEHYLDYPKDDEDELQKGTISARRIGKKMGWSLGGERVYKPDGSYETKANVKMDYWMPRAVSKHLPDHPRAKEFRTLCKRYAIGDVVRTMRLRNLFLAAFEDKKDFKGAQQTYEDEQLLWPLCYTMETRGVRLDLKMLRREVNHLQEMCQQKRKEVEKAAAGIKNFNIDSNRHIASLVVKLGLKITKRTKTGLPSTEIEEMLKHEEHPVIAALLKFKMASKGLTSFLLKYQALSVPDPLTQGTTRAIHPSFNQIGARTGRFSCREPNLQNVPNGLTGRQTECVQARTPFGPRPGYVWIHGDFEQLEARMFAQRAEEEFMLDIFRQGRDIHAEAVNKAWAYKNNPQAIIGVAHCLKLKTDEGEIRPEVAVAFKEMGIRNPSRLGDRDYEALAIDWLEKWGWKLFEAEKALGERTSRQRAKLIMYGKIYGGGAGAVQHLLRCTEREAKAFLRSYDEAFPRIREYGREKEKEGLKYGCVIDAYGHRVTVHPDWGYRAVNYDIQGSAASFVKRQMIRTAEFFAEREIDGHLVMTVHDELVVEILAEHARRGILLDLRSLWEDHEDHFPGVTLPVKLERTMVSWSAKEVIYKVEEAA